MGLIEMLQKYAQCDAQQRITFDDATKVSVPPSELPADITEWPEKLQQKLSEYEEQIKSTTDLDELEAEAQAQIRVMKEYEEGMYSE